MNQFKILPGPVKIVIIALFVIAVAGIVAVSVIYKKLSVAQNPSIVTEEEIKKVVAEVGRLLVLPTDETPTLATVSDPDKLKDQPFFANSEVGDKVLIYTESGKAILWRPSIKKIVEVSALNVPAIK